MIFALLAEVTSTRFGRTVPTITRNDVGFGFVGRSLEFLVLFSSETNLGRHDLSTSTDKFALVTVAVLEGAYMSSGLDKNIMLLAHATMSFHVSRDPLSEAEEVVGISGAGVRLHPVSVRVVF